MYTTTSNKFFEITGIVHEVCDEQTFASGFRKRDLVITNDIDDDSKFKRLIPFSFKKDRADILNTIRAGHRVKVVFAVDGREYNGRYYPELTGIKCEVISGSCPDPNDIPPPAEPDPKECETVEEDSLPF